MKMYFKEFLDGTLKNNQERQKKVIYISPESKSDLTAFS